jgi:hypothetical protein
MAPAVKQRGVGASTRVDTAASRHRHAPVWVCEIATGAFVVSRDHGKWVALYTDYIYSTRND